MKKVNESLRSELKKNSIPYWQLADELGYCENTICKWFRKELDDQRKATINIAIKNILESRKQ